MSKRIRFSMLDTTVIEPRHRLEARKQYHFFNIEVHNLAGSDEAFTYKSETFHANKVIFSRHASSPAAGYTPPLKDGRESLLVRIVDSGGINLINGHEAVAMTPGQVYVGDMSGGYVGITQGIVSYSVWVPYDLLGDRCSRPSSTQAMALDTPVGRVVRANMQVVFAALATTDQVEADLLADGFVGLIKAVFSQQRHDDDTRQHFIRARDRALRRFIDANLRKPDLGSADICRAVGVSRATLHRLLVAEGGVARFVMRRRLERALIDLAQDPPRRGLVTAVAERWAFADTAHFTRQFRARFGFRPTDVIGIGAVGAPEKRSF